MCRGSSAVLFHTIALGIFGEAEAEAEQETFRTLTSREFIGGVAQ
jgi:hypothetical protein